MEFRYKTAADFLWDQKLSVQQMVDVLSTKLPGTQYYHLALVVLGLSPTEIDNALGTVPYTNLEARVQFLRERLVEDKYLNCKDLESFVKQLVTDYPVIKKPAEDLRQRDLSWASLAKFALKTHIPEKLTSGTDVNTRPSLKDAAKAYFLRWRTKLGEEASSKMLKKLLSENSDHINSREACTALKENIENAVNKKISKKQASMVYKVLPDDPPFWKTLAIHCYNYTSDEIEIIMYGKLLRDVVADRLAEVCKHDKVELWRVCERLETAKREGIIPDDAAEYFLNLEKEEDMSAIPDADDLRPIAERLLHGNWEKFLSEKFCNSRGLLSLTACDPKECLIRVLKSEKYNITTSSLYFDLVKLARRNDMQLTEQSLMAALMALTEDFRSDAHTKEHNALRDRISLALKTDYQNTLSKVNPFSWQQTDVYQLSDMYTPLKAVSLGDTKENVNRDTIYMNSLFQRHSLSQQYMIVGDAGSGKTAFCRKLAYEWARSNVDTGVALGTFKFIFIVLIRHLGNQDLCSYLFTAYKAVWESKGILQEDLNEVLGCTLCRKEMLLLVDGYDEESVEDFRESLLYKLLRGHYFSETMKMVTTRPICRLRLKNLFTKGYKIAEFEKREITEFIDKYEAHCPTFQRPDITNHPQRHLLGTPLFLWMFCIYHSSGESPQDTVSSWSAFFKRVMLHMINKTKQLASQSTCELPPDSVYKLSDIVIRCMESGAAANVSLADILKKVKEENSGADIMHDLICFNNSNYNYRSQYNILKEISEFAFQCAKNGKLQFKCHNLSGFVEKLGLVNKVGPTNDGKTIYEFVYKSILEYLAAHYVVHTLKHFTENLQMILEVMKPGQSDTLIIWFICGMLAEKTTEDANASGCLTEVYRRYVLENVKENGHHDHFIYRAAYETGGNIGDNTFKQLPYFCLDPDYCTQYCFLGFIALAKEQKKDIKLHVNIDNRGELEKLLGANGWCKFRMQVAELSVNSCSSQSQTQVQLSNFTLTTELCAISCDEPTLIALLDRAKNTVARLILTQLQVSELIIKALRKFRCIETFIYTHNNLPFDEQFLELSLMQSVQILAVSITSRASSDIIPSLLALPKLRQLSLYVDESDAKLFEFVLVQLMNNDSCIKTVTLPDSANIAWRDAAIRRYEICRIDAKFSIYTDSISIEIESFRLG